MARSRLSYTSGAGESPLLGVTIGQMFDDIVARYPEREALVSVHQKQRLTYRELNAGVDEVARALIGLGIHKGDRVGIWAPNRSEWLVVQLATARVGAILVNINPAYRIHELEYALNQSGCRTLIHVHSFKTSQYEEMLCALCPALLDVHAERRAFPRISTLEHVIAIDRSEAPGIMSWQDFLALAERVSAADLAAREDELEFDDAINIQYTSGTTGFPKGATLSHHNIVNNGYFVAELMKLTCEDRLVVPVPLYHCFGMVLGNLGALSHGATLIYPSEGFDAEAVLRAVQQERATALYGVPTMFIAELNVPNFSDYDLSSLRTGVMAGAPCPVDIMRKVIELMHMREVEIAYGMTETSPVSFQSRVDAPFDKRIGTVGRVHPHTEVKIIDPESGRMRAIGETGELCTRGYSVMLGYWNNPEANAEAIDEHGWIRSGDLATMDAEGYVNIVGRSKDMIVRGGENIYPREIEEYLITHPAVQDVQVTGVPDDRLGEEIIAWVVLKDHARGVTAEDLRAFCEGQIAHFKIPRYFKFVDQFPMTITGKVQKFRMREISAGELGLHARKTA